MNLLAVETSGTIGSIALQSGLEVRERTIDAPRGQTSYNFV